MPCYFFFLGFCLSGARFVEGLPGGGGGKLLHSFLAANFGLEGDNTVSRGCLKVDSFSTEAMAFPRIGMEGEE